MMNTWTIIKKNSIFCICCVRYKKSNNKIQMVKYLNNDTIFNFTSNKLLAGSNLVIVKSDIIINIKYKNSMVLKIINR